MKAASTQSQLPVEQSPPVASENLSVDFNSGPVLDIDWSVASALSDGTFLSQDVHEIDFNITAGDIMGDTATDLDRDWMITSTAHDVGVRSHAEETPVIARGGDASVGVLARVERQGAGDGAGISSSDVMTCGLITAAEIQGLDPPPATVSLFTSAEFRERVLCELMELKAFLQQRMVEVASPGDAQAMIASMAVAESTAGSSCTVGQLLSVGVQEIQGYLRAVEEVESALQTGRLKRVAQLQESRPHLERCAGDACMPIHSPVYMNPFTDKVSFPFLSPCYSLFTFGRNANDILANNPNSCFNIRIRTSPTSPIYQTSFIRNSSVLKHDMDSKHVNSLIYNCILSG